MRYSESINDNVNLIGRIVRGEVIYETMKNVGPNTELIVYYDYKKLNDSYATLYPSLLASTPLMRNHNHHTFICRQTLQGNYSFFQIYFQKCHLITCQCGLLNMVNTKY